METFYGENRYVLRRMSGLRLRKYEGNGLEFRSNRANGNRDLSSLSGAAFASWKLRVVKEMSDKRAYIEGKN